MFQVYRIGFKICCAIALLQLPLLSNAQPGWQDYTKRYYYSILDDRGKEISFKNNKKYQVIIDSKMYKAPYIPKNILTPAVPNQTHGFENYIRINDLSLRLPQKRNRKNALEIKIIYKQDTMHLNQSTGVGSTNDPYGYSKKKEPLPIDFTLQFLPGHYYFPSWAYSLYKQLPKVEGEVTIENFRQSNFIIDRTTYVELSESRYHNDRTADQKAEELVLQNFIKPHFTITTSFDSTAFNYPIEPYERAHIERGILHPAEDDDTYFGLTDVSWNFKNCLSSKNIFSLYDFKNNTLNFWFPKENLRQFSSGKLYIDSFNQVVYQTVRINNKYNSYLNDCEASSLMTGYMYQSKNKGKTWNVNQPLTDLFFKKYKLRYFEFLDENHALGYLRRDKQLRGKKYNIQQGTYYLIKNMVAIDSFKTPDTVHYNSNYCKYDFYLKTNVALLGKWMSDENRGYNKPYQQPMLVKNSAGDWRFKVEQRINKKPLTASSFTPAKYYLNFKLKNGNQLVFRNGSLTFPHKLKEGNYQNIHVVEKGNHIYLLNNKNGNTYISFNGGSTWYVYPTPLDQQSSYPFLTIDDDYTISFFNSRSLYKKFYKFSPI